MRVLIDISIDGDTGDISNEEIREYITDMLDSSAISVKVLDSGDELMTSEEVNRQLIERRY